VVASAYTGVLAAADVFTESTTFWVMESIRLDLGYGSQVHPWWPACWSAPRSAGALREADPELVADDSERLGDALRRVLDGLPDGGRALVVGHSPTNEAALLGLTGEIVAPLAKGAGVRALTGDDRYRVESLGLDL
jgi:hypothetical protein